MDVQVRPFEQLKKIMGQAQLEQQNNNGNVAVECWIKATALARIIHGGSHCSYALCLVKTGQCYYELLGLADQSLQHVLEGKEVLDSIPIHLRDIHSLALANCIAGQSHTVKGQLDSAEKCLLKCEKLSLQYCQTNQPDITLDIKIASALGRLYLKQRKFELAERYLQKALDLHKQETNVRYEKEVLILLKELADIKVRQKKYDEAIDCLTEAERIINDNFGSMSEDKAELLIEVGKSYVTLGGERHDASDATKGEEILWAAYNILLLRKGPSYNKTLFVQDELVKLMILQSRNEEAIKYLKDLIINKSTLYGEGSLEVSRTRRTLGSLYLHSGNIVKASEQLKLARDIFSIVLGPNHHDTMEISTTLEALTGSFEGKKVGDRKPLFQSNFK